HQARRDGGDRPARYGAGNPGGTARADLRAVLHDEGARRRARAVGRAAHGGTAPRLAHAEVPARRGHRDDAVAAPQTAGRGAARQRLVARTAISARRLSIIEPASRDSTRRTRNGGTLNDGSATSRYRTIVPAAHGVSRHWPSYRLKLLPSRS